MNKVLLVALIFLFAGNVYAQKVDSIYFHLYTDSLKKDVHNYINVDGLTNTGQWLPLTDKELNFTSTYGRWEGCSLIIDSLFTGAYVEVTAMLKGMPATLKRIKIYMKTVENDIVLRTEEEVLRDMKRKKK